MAERSFSIKFNGYWREPNISSIPSQSGVYCVYTCIFNQKGKTVSLKRLIYIGESDDVNNRVSSHEKWVEWKRLKDTDQEICFSFAPVDGVDRERVEAALINLNKPPLNSEYKHDFPFDKTAINTSGRNALLKC